MKKTLLSTLVAGALAAGAIGTSYALPLASFDFIGHGGFVLGSASVAPYPNAVYSDPVIAHGVTYYQTLSWG